VVSVQQSLSLPNVFLSLPIVLLFGLVEEELKYFHLIANGKQRKLNGIILKIDFEKAYDSEMAFCATNARDEESQYINLKSLPSYFLKHRLCEVSHKPGDSHFWMFSLALVIKPSWFNTHPYTKLALVGHYLLESNLIGIITAMYTTTADHASKLSIAIEGEGERERENVCLFKMAALSSSIHHHVCTLPHYLLGCHNLISIQYVQKKKLIITSFKFSDKFGQKSYLLKSREKNAAVIVEASSESLVIACLIVSAKVQGGLRECYFNLYVYLLGSLVLSAGGGGGGGGGDILLMPTHKDDPRETERMND
ncbi:hypothetical protein ACJX0J_016024, partial [Zea mays]